MKALKLIIKNIILFAALLTTSNVFATQWQLDQADSQLNFISTKKVHVAETHQFTKIAGTIDHDGQLELIIDLSSVDTAIPIRDERMATFLFDVEQFSSATVSAKIDPEVVDAIALGNSAIVTVDASLSLHGLVKPLVVDVVVTRLVGAKLSVVSLQPAILNVGDFELVSGVEKLRELAGLPSISHAVPVTFYLTFSLKRD